MESKKPLISIVIPCFNDALYVKQSVNSALAQSYQFIEVIVVDDGSNPETKKVLKEIEPQITKLITQENKGQSSARNIGINFSKGEYILVLDSDDFLEPALCEKAVNLLLQNDQVVLVTCEAKLLYQNGSFDFYSPNGGGIPNFMYRNEALGTSMFRKTDWKKCGGYDENMRLGLEDWEFFIRLLKKNGGCAQVIKEPLYNYRKRVDSTTSIANKNKYQLLEYIFVKHKDIYVQDYENFVKKILEISINLETQKQNIYKKRDYKLGHFLLKPIRFLKSIIHK